MLVFDECHVTDEVISCVPSVYVPVAVYCFVCPRAMLSSVLGMIAIDSSTGWLTVSVAVGDEGIELKDAVMLVVRLAVRAVASPVLLIVATVGLDELQVADVVRF